MALVSSTDKDVARTQYDAILAALSYNWEVTVVFFPAAANTHLSTAKSTPNPWKALALYGMDRLYVMDLLPHDHDLLALPVKQISSDQLKETMRQYQWII